MFAELAGQRQLVVQTREKLAGVDPVDGKVLREQPVEAFRGMNILTTVAHQDVLFSSTYGGKTIGFEFTQADGKLTDAETWAHLAVAGDELFVYELNALVAYRFFRLVSVP